MCESWEKVGFKERGLPRQKNVMTMIGAHLASPIRVELGYTHWPQLCTQFGAH